MRKYIVMLLSGDVFRPFGGGIAIVLPLFKLAYHVVSLFRGKAYRSRPSQN
jgi:hypothetical protein